MKTLLKDDKFSLGGKPTIGSQDLASRLSEQLSIEKIASKQEKEVVKNDMWTDLYKPRQLGDLVGN